MNSKIGKIIVVSRTLTVVNGLKKYFCNQAFENVVFLHISFPQISPLLSLYKLYNLLSANRAFPLLVLKNFNFNVHARLVVPFATAAVVGHKKSIIWFNIIIRLPDRWHIYQKTKEYIYSNKIVYCWSLEMAKIRKLVIVYALK